VSVYLSVASFVYILKSLEKRYYVPNGRSVTVSALKPGVQIFSFTEYDSGSADCGFIQTNLGLLKDIFDDSELAKVLTLCKREHEENTNITRHCAIGKDPALKNNIPTSTDGKDLNCLKP